MTPEFVTSAVSYINNLPIFLRLIIISITTALEYIFPIFPGDTVILLAGFLSAKGGLGILELLIAVLVGSFVGVWLAYNIGYALLLGHVNNLLEKYIKSSRLEQINRWYNTWGYWLIIINRFIPGIRSFFFVAAGFYKLAIRKILIYGLLSALIFNSLLFALGYLVGNNIEKLFYILDAYTYIIYIILLIIISGLVYKFFLARKN